jgi:dCMP deaminase
MKEFSNQFSLFGSGQMVEVISGEEAARRRKAAFNKSRGRPEWVDYFIGLAFMVSRRSLDPNTKHGCVITDRHNHILAVGYNSFPHGMDDSSIPTNRPDPEKPDELSKYDFVEGTHSERNAVFNCMVSPWMIPGGAVAYVTGEPCNVCLAALWQSNIKSVYYAKRPGSLLLNEKTRRVRDKIVLDTGMELIEVTPQLDWMYDGLEEHYKLGFFKKVQELYAKIHKVAVAMFESLKAGK